MRKGPLSVLFTTVLMDLVGFGMIIPLIGLYGRHFGAEGWRLAVLGAAYSFFQFWFAPIWGGLSDRVGRRPVLLFSLTGSALAYAGFALAGSFEALLATRIFAGIFAANLPVAQAYVADVTPPEGRARGMGMIGAAYGIGFTLGPAVGGIAAHYGGLAAPGWIASGVCALNAILAYHRLPESFPAERRTGAPSPLFSSRLRALFPALPESFPGRATLFVLLFVSFAFTFAFSNMEQTLSLFLQARFEWPTETTGLRAGLLLMFSGLLGAATQGVLVRRYAFRIGEGRMLLAGLLFFACGMLLFMGGPSYAAYFIFVVPAALGAGLVQPSLSALVSRLAPPTHQGQALGSQQALASLARVAGPLAGLSAFSLAPALPFAVAAAAAAIAAIVWIHHQRRKET